MKTMFNRSRDSVLESKKFLYQTAETASESVDTGLKATKENALKDIDAQITEVTEFLDKNKHQHQEKKGEKSKEGKKGFLRSEKKRTAIEAMDDDMDSKRVQLEKLQEFRGKVEAAENVRDIQRAQEEYEWSKYVGNTTEKIAVNCVTTDQLGDLEVSTSENFEKDKAILMELGENLEGKSREEVCEIIDKYKERIRDNFFVTKYVDANPDVRDFYDSVDQAREYAEKGSEVEVVDLEFEKTVENRNRVHLLREADPAKLADAMYRKSMNELTMLIANNADQLNVDVKTGKSGETIYTVEDERERTNSSGDKIDGTKVIIAMNPDFTSTIKIEESLDSLNPLACNKSEMADYKNAAGKAKYKFEGDNSMLSEAKDTKETLLTDADARQRRAEIDAYVRSVIG